MRYVFPRWPIPTINQEWDTYKIEGQKTKLEVDYTVKMPLYQRVVEVINLHKSCLKKFV